VGGIADGLRGVGRDRVDDYLGRLGMSDKLQGLEPYLKSRIIGQEDALARVSRAIEAEECDLNDRGPRPKGAFLFMGSRGIGKTETAKAFTEYLFGTGGLTMLFMNEYQRADDVDELVCAIKRGIASNCRTFLFDEIEKAHRGVIDVFISLLDEGQITDADGSRLAVGNCYLVLTSNIGAARWGSMERTQYARMESFADEQARKTLRPELFNRLTETIVFRPLSQEVQIEILGQMLAKKLAHLESKFAKGLAVGAQANAHLLRKCFTQSEGARRLRQELDRQINFAALPWVLSGRTPAEGLFCYDPKTDQLVLK
jgi:ATP-dependent Clp protease ATP-binding subunit ClpA